MTSNEFMVAIGALGEALLTRDEAIAHWQQRALAAEARLEALESKPEDTGGGRGLR